MDKATVTLYLDTRRKKEAASCPLKLRVYYQYDTRLYTTGIHLSKEDFAASYLSAKPKGEEHKALRVKILAVLAKAQAVIDDLRMFSFEVFEKRLFRPSGAATDVFYAYEQTISRLRKEERMGTVSSYEVAYKSLKSFVEEQGRKTTRLSFNSVTPHFLQAYERWMLQGGKSISTVGIYLRTLRTLFNNAIAEGEVPRELYPFGKRKYQIPASRNIKKALSRDELKKLFEQQEGVDVFMAKARDFWFFSYICSGMNVKDICELRQSNLREDTLVFVRAKTRHTTRAHQKPIVVALTPFARGIIERYGSAKVGADPYLFSILNDGMDAAQRLRAVQAFTRFINQHIKRLAKMVGITEEISTYWARHSFTTMSIHHGASMEWVQDSLGHASLATTMHYWKGFEEQAKREITNKLMNF